MSYGWRAGVLDYDETHGRSKVCHGCGGGSVLPIQYINYSQQVVHRLDLPKGVAAKSSLCVRMFKKLQSPK